MPQPHGNQRPGQTNHGRPQPQPRPRPRPWFPFPFFGS